MSQMRPALSLVLLVAALVALLSACRRGDDDVLFAVDEAAKIACTATCAARGQCGTLPDNQRVVLANEGGPSVSIHDRLFFEGAPVTVVESNPRQLIAARDGQPLIGQATPFLHTFYRVNGEGRTAWVSEWCLARP